MDLKKSPTKKIVLAGGVFDIIHPGHIHTLNDSIKCELIRLERTHHDNSVIELVSKNNLRKIARLKTGSKVTIKIDS